MFAKSIESHYKLPVQEAGWKSLKQSIDVRNRLTHPKTYADLRVTEREFQEVETAYQWIKEKYEGLLEVLICRFMEVKFKITEGECKKYYRQ